MHAAAEAPGGDNTGLPSGGINEKGIRNEQGDHQDETRWLLEAINEQYEAICSHGDRIPQIEFDIIMDNLRKFYEDLQTLKRMDDPRFLMSGRQSTGSTKECPRRGTRIRGSETLQAPEAGQPYQPRSQSRPAAVAAKPETRQAAGKKPQTDEIDLFATEEPLMSTRLKEARERTFSRRSPRAASRTQDCDHHQRQVHVHQRTV